MELSVRLLTDQVTVPQIQPPLDKRELHTVSLPCPYGHEGRTFQGIDQLLAHAKVEHSAKLDDLDDNLARLALDHALKNTKRLPRDGTGVSAIPGPRDVGLRGINNYRKKRKDRSKRADKEVSTRDEPKRAAYGRSSPLSPRYLKSNSKEERPNTKFRPVASTQQLPIQPLITTSPWQPGLIELQKYDPRYPGLLLQPDSQPISQEQLASELRSIYAGLLMVEAKCTHVDRAQAAATHDTTQKLAPDHWQAFIALHRTLLHEHHDFFLASQHPSASPALKRLATKYTMPARMWKHGIHAFLELLRTRLPGSLDYMLAFIYLAYQMIALLYETVPAFEVTWIECLGDLGRYRMAIEDEDIRDRETWTEVARSWYTKAADLSPATGRLYHHLAILARGDYSRQLYYYTRCMTSLDPFLPVRESIYNLFKRYVSRGPSGHDPIEMPWGPSLPCGEQFAVTHAYLFIMLRKKELGGTIGREYHELFIDNDPSRKYREVSSAWIHRIEDYITKRPGEWKDGVHFAVGNIAAWFDYGSTDNALRQSFLWRQTPDFVRQEELGPGEPPCPDLTKPSMSAKRVSAEMEKLVSDAHLLNAMRLTHEVFAVVLGKNGDEHVLAHVHVLLGFLSALASDSQTLPLITSTPWSELAAFLNELIASTKMSVQGIAATMKGPLFTKEESNCDEHKHRQYDEQPLPEDYLMQGLVWAVHYFPKDWFDNGPDEEERTLELASTSNLRIMRILRLAYGLSLLGHWISFNEDTARFSAQPQVDPQLLRNEQERWVTNANQERGKDGQSLTTTSKKRVAVVAYLKRSLSSPRPLNDRWQSFVKEKLKDMDVMFFEQAGKTSKQGLVQAPGWVTRNAMEEADVIVVIDNGWIQDLADAKQRWVDSELENEWAKTARRYVHKLGNKVVLWNWSYCRCDPLRSDEICGKCGLEREGRPRFARTATEMREKVMEVVMK